MIAPGLIPKAGMNDLTPDAWIAAITDLSGRIAQLRESTCELSSVAIFERALIVDTLNDQLVDLVCLPKAQPWLVDLAAGGCLVPIAAAQEVGARLPHDAALRERVAVVYDRARREWRAMEADRLRKGKPHPTTRVPYRRPGLLEELRTAAPLFVPGILINRFLIRGVEVLLSPLVMAAPELEKRIRPRVGRLCDISNASWAVRVERAAWLWLLQERGSEPESTEDGERLPEEEEQAAWLGRCPKPRDIGFFDPAAARASLRAKRAIEGTEKCGVGGSGDAITSLHSGTELAMQNLTNEEPVLPIDEHHHG